MPDEFDELLADDLLAVSEAAGVAAPPAVAGPMMSQSRVPASDTFVRLDVEGVPADAQKGKIAIETVHRTGGADGAQGDPAPRNAGSAQDAERRQSSARPAAPGETKRRQRSLAERGGATAKKRGSVSSAGIAGTPTGDGTALGPRSLHVPRSAKECERWMFHRKGVYCKACGKTP